MQHLSVDIAAAFKEGRRARLLIVDDNPFIRDLHTIVLRMTGYEVETAENGVEALERLADTPFDLVVTDRYMPGIDGVTVILALRSAGSNIPVIMVSASLSYTGLPPLIAREVFAAFSKPANTADILRAVAEALQPGEAEERRRRPQGLRELAA